jgi:electron transfer flavoprotein beta subunit
MLPSVLDPWAGHALYEAAHLAKEHPGSKVWWLALSPKAKLQQLMMSMAQKIPFEFVAVDGSASGFVDSWEVAEALAKAVESIEGLDRSNLLLFGGWESASRGACSTMQMLGERLGIRDQFQGVDELIVGSDGSLRILERVEGGRHQIAVCEGPPAVLGWATGKLPEPPNNPQIGMANMRSVMPALQRAQPAQVGTEGIEFSSVELPKQRRDTKVVDDLSVEEIAQELVEWIESRQG